MEVVVSGIWRGFQDRSDRRDGAREEASIRLLTAETDEPCCKEWRERDKLVYIGTRE